ncbi:Uncharacterized protein APZ42_023042, partial [Daphnia magna]
MYYVVVIHAHICLVSLTKSPLLETTRIERLRLLFLPLCVRVCVWMDGPHWICIGWGPHWHLSTDPHANQYGGFHLSGTVTAPKTSGGSPLPPPSSSGGGGGAAGGGVVVPGGTTGGAVGGGGTGGPPVETEKKYRVSVSFDR